jgi:hypothetical protein
MLSLWQQNKYLQQFWKKKNTTQGKLITNST